MIKPKSESVIKLIDLLKEAARDAVFSTKDVKGNQDVVLHKIITIKPFINTEDERRIVLKPFHFVLGKNSLAIFNAFETDEVAGLKREDCVEFLAKNKSEKDDAFIAGLTNVKDGKLFMFFNMDRMQGETLPKERLVPHESLHLTRHLLTFMENKNINLKDEDWWKGVEFTKLKDGNEELFAEVLETCTYIAFNQLSDND